MALVPGLAGAALGRIEKRDASTRVGGLLDRVDTIIDRADEAIASVAATRAKADAAIDGVVAIQAKADAAIEGVTRTQAKADVAIRASVATQQKADEAIGRVGGEAATPTARSTGRKAWSGGSSRCSASTSRRSRRWRRRSGGWRHPGPAEVEALVTLIDRLPQLVTHLDEDILPVLESLGDVGTDVHDLVDTVQDLRQVVKGFPGSRLFRRRGAEEIAEEEARGREGAGS